MMLFYSSTRFLSSITNGTWGADGEEYTKFKERYKLQYKAILDRREAFSDIDIIDHLNFLGLDIPFIDLY